MKDSNRFREISHISFQSGVEFAKMLSELPVLYHTSLLIIYFSLIFLNVDFTYLFIVYFWLHWVFDAEWTFFWLRRVWASRCVWGLLIQQLSLCSRAWEPQLLSPCAAATEACTSWSLCSTTREDTAMRSPHITRKSSPCSLKLEKTHAQQQRQFSQK